MRGALVGLALASAVSAHSQITLLSEGFEGAFPGSWSVGDSNAASGIVSWRDVNSGFGSVSARTGNWKGYAAGVSNGFAVSVAQYANNMQAYMSRSVNLAGHTGANLSFWYNIPSIESCCDALRVYVDNVLLFQTSSPTPGWRQAAIPLNGFLGATRTLRFQFNSDTSVIAEGAHLDDISVRGHSEPLAQSLQSLAHANYSGYVLASDTIFGRSNIQVQAVFSLENFTGASANYTNVMSFRLMNATTGQPHPIFDLGNAATNVNYTYNVTNNLLLLAGTNLLGTNVAQIRPAAWMSQFDPFYVECRMLTNGVLAQTLTTAPTNFYHFTNTVSGDVAYNVLLNLTNAAWSRTYMVGTVPGQDSFRVNVGYQIRRWDDFNGPSGVGANVPVVFNCELRDSLGNAVPLTNPSQSFLVSVTNYTLFFFSNPSFRTASQVLDIRPAAQLDSPNKTYYITVTLAHTNNPVTGQVLTANSRATSTNRLLHFNGGLVFGPVSTTLTTLGAPAPPVNPPAGGVIPTTLSSAGGFLTGKPGYTFSGANLGVNLLANGNAVVTGGSTSLIPPASPDDDEVAKVRFTRDGLVLNSSGLTAADISVILPAGMGYANDPLMRTLNSTLVFLGVPLNQQLHPLNDPVLVPAGPMWVTEESKPLNVRVSSVTWVVAGGRFVMPTAGADQVHYVRAEALNALEASPVPAAQKVKPSNEMFYRWVKSVGPAIEVDSGQVRTGAQLTASFELEGAGSVATAHFPYRAVYRGGPGQIAVVSDRIQPATSFISTPAGDPGVDVPFSADCTEPGCGTTPDGVSRLLPDSNRLVITQEGGLAAGGALDGPMALKWGWIPTMGAFAHETTQFTTGRVHIAGHFIRGSDTAVSDNLRPAVILFAGANALTGVIGERPSTGAYAVGDLDYAGLNFRCGAPRDATDSGMTGRSTLGGGSYGPYPLKKRSKYYVRKSGVSGIHDKVFGSPEKVLISGYDFTLNNFGLAFLSNDNVDSRTEGSLFLPHPSDYTLAFEKLLFLCNGALDKATVSGGTQTTLAAYWNAPLDISAMEFTRDPAQICNPGEGYLALGVAAYMAHVRDTLYGRLGVFAHGNLIPKGKGIPDLDSRFSAPSQVQLRGPKRAAPGSSGFETYYVTPTAGAFFNIVGAGPNYPFQPGAATGPLANGFINLPGLTKVSYFQAIESHLQTASHRPPVDPNDPGQWGVADLPMANGSWSGTSFFTGSYHDPDNRGFPGALGGAALSNYRTNATYFVHAKQKWLGGAIQFDYPVKWDFPTRSFRSMDPVKNDFLVVNIEHRIAYLSAEHADVRFGAQVGLPQLNFANFVVNTLDDATGMAKTVSDSLGEQLVGALNDGMTRVNEVLCDRLDEYIERFAGPAIDTLVDEIYAELMTHWNVAANDWNGGSPPSLAAFLNGAGSDLRQKIINRLGAGGFVGGGLNQIGQLQEQLDKVLFALDAFTGPGGLLELAGDGTVATSLVQNLARNLIQELLGSLDQNLAAVVGSATASALNDLITPHLSSAEPTLSQLRTVLLDVRSAVSVVRDKLSGGQEFFDHIDSLFNSALGEFTAVGAAVDAELASWLNTFGPAKKLPSVAAAQVKLKIRQSITDRLLGTAFMANLQSAIKERIFDLNNALKSGMDSVFGQVNGVVKGALTSAMTELDDAFGGALGDVGGSMATAALDGYALFNGDALKKVRIDGKVQWSIPEKSSFSAYIEVNQFFSGPDGGYCGNPGVDACEVKIGADDVPCDFLSPDLRINVGVKITFRTTSGAFIPANFAGGFVKTAGDITFEAFKITDLACSVAFGEFENYVSAALGLEFNSYKAKGGIFFGRTCTLDPIKMWDPLVAEAIGEPSPTFTGGYVYAEAHIPVSECILGIPASCFFQVTAGVGLGVFYFVEGPTYGARGALEVGGDALCILSLTGRIDMVGLKQGSKFKLLGNGRVAVVIGWCPFCIEAGKSVKIATETGGGKAKGSSPSVK